MKKFIVFLLSAAASLSLAACTPTPEKQGESSAAMPPTTEAFKADTMEIRNSGNEELPEMATVSVYRINKNRNGLVQEMESLETEELETEGVIQMLIQYEILEEGTELISFEQNDGKAVLNLSKITSQEDPMEIRLVVESLVNTFTENFELESGLILQENGQVYTIDSVEADEDGTMYYNADYRNFDGTDSTKKALEEKVFEDVTLEGYSKSNE
ncbi:MAG: hypothetical protein HFG49_06325 [Lachnospiraceae bacterium]|jgi:hypothetical protein|nr:hypothetical protein [Lachnospiraceae bacterium]